jgi:hypothetical protein
MEAKNELGYKALFGGLIFLLSFVSGAVPQIFVGLFERHKNFIGIANVGLRIFYLMVYLLNRNNHIYLYNFLGRLLVAECF